MHAIRQYTFGPAETLRYERIADPRPGSGQVRITVEAAGVHLIGTAAAGSMSLYLPGGPDEGWMSRDGLFVSYTLLDFGMLLSFWGVLVGAAAVATLSFGRNRVLPRWMGVVSVIACIPPIALGLGMALPGFPGLVMPIWLVVISIGMMVSRTARA